MKKQVYGCACDCEKRKKATSSVPKSGLLDLVTWHALVMQSWCGALFRISDKKTKGDNNVIMNNYYNKEWLTNIYH